MKELEGMKRVTPDDGVDVPTRREEIMVVVSATWLILGLFLDGYAHQHLIAEGESFVTPWHAVFYAGFLATATSIGLILYRRPGRTLRDRAPSGYWPAVLGLGGFAIGGVGDALWHTLFGVEVGVDALLSPTHLLLMASLLAIVTGPYRAAIARSLEGRGLPLVSLGVGTALVAFFLNFVWGLGDAGYAVAYNPATGAGEREVIAGVASALVTTTVFTCAVLFVLRLGRPRFGTFTLLFGLISLAVHVAFDEQWAGVVAASVAGVILDAMIGRVTPVVEARWPVPIAIAAMWSLYFVVPAIDGRLAWRAEISIGTVVLAGLASAVLVVVADSRPTGTTAIPETSRA